MERIILMILVVRSLRRWSFLNRNWEDSERLNHMTHQLQTWTRTLWSERSSSKCKRLHSIKINPTRTKTQIVINKMTGSQTLRIHSFCVWGSIERFMKFRKMIIWKFRPISMVIRHMTLKLTLLLIKSFSFYFFK